MAVSTFRNFRLVCNDITAPSSVCRTEIDFRAMYPVKQFALILISILLYSPSVMSGQTTRQYLEDFKNPEVLESFLDSLVTAEMEEEFLPGAGFILVKDGKTVLRKGYGKANLESNTFVDPSQTIFRIGSITKVFTAMALMQLVDRGKVALSDEVNDYLDDSLRIESPYNEAVRIWHLLSHTAGFDQIFQDRLFYSKEERPDIHSFLKGQLRPIRSPGLVSTYDTYGITLAGHIVERVSGLGYAEYMSKHIFEPLGMGSSFVEVDRQNRDRLAAGYGYENGAFIPQPYEWYATTPASSIDATLSDMALFISALLGDGGALFSPQTAKMIRLPMFHNYPGLPGFAYGFWEEYRGSIRAIYHGGIMRGYTGRMYLLPEFNLGFYLVYNRDLESGPDPRLRFILTQALMERWFGPEQVSQKPDTAHPFPVDTEKFDGVYADNLYCHTCFEGTGADRSIFPVESRGDGKLFMWGSMFYAISPNIFLTESGKTKAVFLQGFDGEVRYMGMNIRPNMYEKLGE